MLTNQLPSWGKAPIENYLKTGDFKNHERFPVPQNEMQEGVDEAKALRDFFVASDNSETDPDKRPGFVEGSLPWLGDYKGQFKESEDGNSMETVQHFGSADNSNEAIIYTRQTPDSFDQIVVTRKPDGADDGAWHFSSSDANGSYMTFPPEA